MTCGGLSTTSPTIRCAPTTMRSAGCARMPRCGVETQPPLRRWLSGDHGMLPRDYETARQQAETLAYALLWNGKPEPRQWTSPQTH